MVPEGWRSAKLGDHVIIHSGFAPSSLEITDEGNTPYVKVDDLNNCSTFQEASKARVNFEGRRLPRNTVIFPKRGAAIMNNKVRIASVEMILDTNMMGLEAKSSMDPMFLYYRLIFEQLFKIADTSTIPQINNKHIIPYQFPLPPLAEQKRIAEVLGVWDRAIAVAGQQLDLARTQKRALMQTLLTPTRRFSGFDGQPWKEVLLSSIAEPITDRNDGDDLPVLTISSKSGFVRQDEKYSRYMAGESVKKYYRLRRGEFAYNKGNSLTFPFGCVMRLEEFHEGLVPHVYVCFRMKAEVDSDFYRLLFMADYLQPQLAALVNTGVRNNGLLNISPKAFWTVKVPLPSRSEQHAIAAVLSGAVTEERNIETQITCLQSEKKALMQQLLTGKKRLAV
jgi:type I restriction enzyme S subunit